MQSQIHTLLFLDPQPNSQANRLFDAPDTVVVTVKESDRARHALTTMEVDVWVCDLGTPGLNFMRLREAALEINGDVKIVLTGSASYANVAQKAVESEQAVAFVPRPWKAIDLRNAVSRARSASRPPKARRIRIRPKTAAPTARKPSEVDSRISTEADSHRYHLVERIGEGGTGVVWKARDLLLEMDVAIKVLHGSLAEDADAIAAMKQEAIVAMRLAHTCIVRLFNFARVGTNYFLVMEYVEGRTFHALLREAGSFTPHAVMGIIRVCADALNYAHRHGVLHNDLKPANILLSTEGIVKIIDFGVASLVGHQRDLGEIVGTPQYMSPEQLRGDLLGPQTDIYALATIAYELLTGKLPYPPGTDFSKFEEIQRLPLSGLPPGITAVLNTATAPDPMERYASIADFARAFQHAYHTDYEDGGPSTDAPVIKP